MSINYGFAALFGLIHGMGFSNFFRATALPGDGKAFILQLFAFNLGVEAGQVIIIAIILVLAGLSFRLFKVRQNYWNWGVSGIAALFSAKMIIERLMDL